MADTTTNKEKYEVLFDLGDANQVASQLQTILEGISGQFSDVTHEAHNINKTNGDMSASFIALDGDMNKVRVTADLLGAAFLKYRENSIRDKNGFTSFDDIFRVSGVRTIETAEEIAEKLKVIADKDADYHLKLVARSIQKEIDLIQKEAEQQKTLTEKRDKEIYDIEARESAKQLAQLESILNKDITLIQNEAEQQKTLTEKRDKEIYDIEARESAKKLAQIQKLEKDVIDFELKRNADTKALTIKREKEIYDIEAREYNKQQALLDNNNKEILDKNKQYAKDGNPGFLTATGAALAVAAGNLISRAILEVGRGFRQAASNALDFEQELARIKALYSNTDMSLSGTRGLSNKYGVDFNQEAAASGKAALAGFAGDTDLIVEEANKLKVIFNIDLNEAVKIITTSLNAYGESAKDASKVTSEIVTAIKYGKNIDFNKFAEGIGTLEGYGHALGILRTDIFGFIDGLSQQGIATDKAIKILQNFYNIVLKPSPELSKTVQEMGYPSTEALVRVEGLVGAMSKLNNIAKEKGLAELLGDVDNWRSASGIILNTSEGFDKLSDSVKNFKTNMQDASETSKDAMSNIGTDWQKFGNTLKNIPLAIIKPFADMASAGLEAVTHGNEIEELNRIIHRNKMAGYGMDDKINNFSRDNEIKEANEDYKKAIENAIILRQEAVKALKSIKEEFVANGTAFKTSIDLWKESYIKALEEVKHEHSELETIIKSTGNELATFKEKLERKQFEESISHLPKRLQSRKEFEQASLLGNKSASEQNIAEGLLKEGKIQEALEHFKKAQSLVDSASEMSQKAFEDGKHSNKFNFAHGKDFRDMVGEHGSRELETKALEQQHYLQSLKTKELERQNQLTKELAEAKKQETINQEQAKIIMIEQLEAAEKIKIEDKDTTETLTDKYNILERIKNRINSRKYDPNEDTFSYTRLINNVEKKENEIKDYIKKGKDIKNIDETNKNLEIVKNMRTEIAQLNADWEKASKLSIEATEALHNKVQDDIQALKGAIDKLEDLRTNKILGGHVTNDNNNFGTQLASNNPIRNSTGSSFNSSNNFGDINVNINGNTGQLNPREIAVAIRRELIRGTVPPFPVQA